MSAILACLVPLILALFLVWMEKLERLVLRTGEPETAAAEATASTDATDDTEAVSPAREDLPTTKES